MKFNLNNLQGLYSIIKVTLLLIIVFKIISFLNDDENIFNSAPKETIYHSVSDSVEHIRLVENNKILNN